MGIEKLRYYLQALRINHWFKNCFMVVGSLAAIVHFNLSLSPPLLLKILVAFLLACFLSSANYLVNQVTDASFDKNHPAKKTRPLPSGKISANSLLILSFFLLIISLATAYIFLNKHFLVTLLVFFLAGVAYNIPPLRLKDIPYIDVISESFNNPIRLFLGWYSLTLNFFPPLSLVFLSWVLGAFLMTAKRYAEFNSFPSKIALYRKTFRFYSAQSLLIMMLFYASLAILLFIYFALALRKRLLFGLPFALFSLIWLFQLTMEEGSIIQTPEKIFKRPKFVLYNFLLFIFLVILAL